MNTKQQIQALLGKAGVTVGGTMPYDIKVNDERFYKRVIRHGTLGLGEAYMEKWWECESLDQFFDKLLRARLDKEIWNIISLKNAIIAAGINMQQRKQAKKNVNAHYDIGNDLYQVMLDPTMAYTCAYWNNGATTLYQAQIDKFELSCKKLGLKKEGPILKILDIGGGWGGFAKYAVQNYNVNVVIITLSENQIKLGKELCKGLPIEFRLQDYRDVKEKFDYIVSFGMFEHVGYKNYRAYFDTLDRCLKPNGLSLLHTLGSNKTNIIPDAFVSKYIFPGAHLPSIKLLGRAFEENKVEWVMEDWHNLNVNYEKTLLEWFKNFDENYESLKANYDETFYRMWKYYLLSFAGVFRAREIQLWQIVLSRNGVRGGYVANYNIDTTNIKF